jgi:hypothetical protein
MEPLESGIGRCSPINNSAYSSNSKVSNMNINNNCHRNRDRNHSNMERTARLLIT